MSANAPFASIPPRSSDAVKSQSVSVGSLDGDGAHYTRGSLLDNTFDYGYKDETAPGVEPPGASLPIPLREASPEGRTLNRRRWTKRSVLYPSALGAALVFVVALWLHTRMRLPPPAIPPLDLPTVTFLNEVLQKFVVAKEPSCFLNHASFTAETPEARAAMESFRDWLHKMMKWQGIQPSDYAAAVEIPSAGGPQRLPLEAPRRWELLLLQGALTCYDLPTLEESAGFCPYNPLHRGTYEFVVREGVLEVSAAAAADKERSEEIRRGEGVLRANAAKVSIWITEVYEELHALASAKAERLQEALSPALREQEELELKEIKEALLFYDKMKVYATKREPPQRAEGAEPAPDDLKTVELFVLRANNAAAEAMASMHARAAAAAAAPATAGAAEGVSSDESLLAPNRYIPAWLPHLFLSRHDERNRLSMKMRMQVVAAGLPPFATKSVEGTAEFISLLNESLAQEGRREQLEGMPVDSDEKTALQRHMMACEMQTELAAASMAAIFQRNALMVALKKRGMPAARLEAMRASLAGAYDMQGAAALKWIKKAAGGEFPLVQREKEELGLALQHIVNAGLLRKKLIFMQEEAAKGRPDHQMLLVTREMFGVSQKQIAGAASGSLHEAKLLPLWFAHLA